MHGPGGIVVPRCDPEHDHDVRQWMSCLDQHVNSFRTIPSGALTLWKLNIGLLDVRTYNEVHDTDPVELVVLWEFMIVCVIFFVNMLAAH